MLEKYKACAGCYVCREEVLKSLKSQSWSVVWSQNIYYTVVAAIFYEKMVSGGQVLVS
jgi:hypothetical protein